MIPDMVALAGNCDADHRRPTPKPCFPFTRNALGFLRILYTDQTKTIPRTSCLDHSSAKQTFPSSLLEKCRWSFQPRQERPYRNIRGVFLVVTRVVEPMYRSTIKATRLPWGLSRGVSVEIDIGAGIYGHCRLQSIRAPIDFDSGSRDSPSTESEIRRHGSV